MKIGTKLIAVITAVNLLCIGGLTVSSLVFTSDQVSTMALDNSGTITRGAAYEIKGWLENYLGEIRSIGQILSHFDHINPEDRRTILNSILHSFAMENPVLIGVWVAYEPNALDGMDAAFVNTLGSDASGRFISYFANLNNNVILSPILDYDDPGSAGDFYNISFRSGKEAIIEPYYYELEGKNVLITSLTVPIKRDGRVIGVAGVDVELTEIQEIVAQIRPFGDGITAVFTNSGKIVAHPDKGRLGVNVQETEADMIGDQLGALVKSLRNGEEYQSTVFSPEFGSNMIFQLRPFFIGNSRTPWAVATLVPQTTIMAQVNRMILILSILGIFIMGIITLIVFFVAHTITSPLKSMEKVFVTVGEGDFTNVLTAKGNDEIGSISRSFNNTMEKIRMLIVTIKDQSANLFDIGSNLAASMDETASAVTQITANIQSIKNQVINQSASVTETNATMEQISGNINKLSDHVGVQSENVSQSSSAIEEMLANIGSVTQTLVKNSVNVKKLIEASDMGRTSVKEVVTDIQEIERESEGLLQINAVMENIAGQTNLLSMNAAIEAAHAGESGKGFAVVAAEIRKLAESSEEQSKTISVVLKKIKTSIDKISGSTDKVLTKFEAIDAVIKIVFEQEENIRNAMEEQGVGSKQILEAVSQLNSVTQNVKTGAEEMLEGSKEVINESKNLEQVTANITNGMSEMAAGASQINSAVIQVREISDNNKNSIDTLIKAVSRFKIE